MSALNERGLHDQLIEARLDRCKWIIRHSRMTDEVTFGPFDSAAEAVAWADERGFFAMAQPLIPPDEPRDTMWIGWR